jgi:hypothetical protein
LFSRPDVSTFVNKNFEPVWVSVRPVPLIHIDFGNGKVMTRTLHGNIATYVCTAEGDALDIVAGIYTPNVYIQRLDQARLLAGYVDQEGRDKRGQRLIAYHKGQAEALAKNALPPQLFPVPADFGKARIERTTKTIMLVAVPGARPAAPAEKLDLKAPEDLASWNVLAEDTRANEAVRRRQVSELLASSSLVKPEAITKKVYKDILHADLDDPYLGLGGALFAGYPFKDKNGH